MRLYLACLVLLVAPAAIVFGIKEYEARQAGIEALPTLPDRGEVLFFNASWCGPCKQMRPIVMNMKRQGYRMRDVDIDRHRDLAQEYDIRSVPTFVFLENGSEVNRFSGGTSKEHLRDLCSSPAYR